MTIKPGDRVRIPTKEVTGTVRFIGTTSFATGVWIGVELDEPKGKNNGTVKDTTYFSCKEEYGMFVRMQHLEKIELAGTVSTAKDTPIKKAAAPAKTPVKKEDRTASTSSVSSNPDVSTSPPAQRGSIAARPASSDSAPPSPTKIVPAPVVTAPTTAKPPPVTSAAVGGRTGTNGDQARDLERYKLQCEQLMGFKQKWLDTQHDLETKLRAAREEATMLRAKLESDVLQLAETAEMATLDKEMAEGRLADMEIEMMELRDSCEELSLKVEIYEEEHGELSGNTEVSGAGQNGVAIKTLEGQNSRLKQALMLLREKNDQAHLELDATKQALMDQTTHHHIMSEQLALKTKELNKAEAALRNLNEQVDATAGSANMLEELSQKNLALEDRLNELMEEVHDLTTITDMNEQADEMRAEMERDLRAELDAAATRLFNFERVFVELGSQNQEYQTTVGKLSTRVKELQEQVVELEATTGKQQTFKLEKDKETKMILEKNVKLASSADRARSNAVELELRKLDSDQSFSHSELLKKSLPDSFFNTDYDGLRLVLLLERLPAKAIIVKKHAIAQFRLNEDLTTLLGRDSDISIDHISFGRDLVDLTTALTLCTQYFSWALGRANDTLYQTMAGMFMELSKHEAPLDAILSKLVGDGIDSTMKLDGLRLALRHFEHVASTHLQPQHCRPDADFLADSMTALTTTADVAEIEFKRLEAIFSKTSVEGSQDPAFLDTLGRVRTWMNLNNDLKHTCRKVARSFPDARDTFLVVPNDLRATLVECVGTYRNMTAGIRSTAASAWQHTHSAVTLKALPYETALQMAVAQRIDLTKDGVAFERAQAEGADTSLLPIFVDQLVTRLTTSVKNLCESLLRGEYDKPALASEESSTAPWVARAALLRQQIAESLSLVSQLEEKKKELAEARRLLKIKDKEMSEQGVLLQHSQKQVDLAKGELEKKINGLETELGAVRAELKAAVENHEVEVGILERDIQDLQAERQELKKRVDAGGAKASKFARTPGTVADASSADVKAARVQVQVLEQTLSCVRMELAGLRGAQKRSELKLLPRLPVLVKKAEDSEAAAKNVAEAHAYLKSVLLRLATPTMVDITKGYDSTPPPAAEGAASATPPKTKPSLTPATQLARSATGKLLLCRAGDKLLAQMRTTLISESVSAKAATAFSTFTSNNFAKCLEERRHLPLLAKIKVPGVAAAQPASQALIVTATQFQHIHAVLAGTDY